MLCFRITFWWPQLTYTNKNISAITRNWSKLIYRVQKSVIQQMVQDCIILLLTWSLWTWETICCLLWEKFRKLLETWNVYKFSISGESIFESYIWRSFSGMWCAMIWAIFGHFAPKKWDKIEAGPTVFKNTVGPDWSTFIIYATDSTLPCLIVGAPIFAKFWIFI